MNNNRLENIKIFIAIAEHRSFTKAADDLGLSRAHLSRRLKELESQLEAQLIIRTTRTLKLTEVGEYLFKTCRQSFFEVEQSIRMVKDQNESMCGNIRINAVGGVIGEKIGSIICGFLSDYPQINIHLDFSSGRVNLIEEEYDFVIRMGALEDSELIARKLADIRINTFASPDYISQHSAIDKPADLEHHHCLSGSVRKWHYHHKQTKQSYLLKTQGRYQVKSGHVLVQAAIKGVGIIRIPEIYCADAVKNGQLVPVFSDWYIQSVPLYLLYTKSRYTPLRLQKFSEYMYRHILACFSSKTKIEKCSQ